MKTKIKDKIETAPEQAIQQPKEKIVFSNEQIETLFHTAEIAQRTLENIQRGSFYDMGESRRLTSVILRCLDLIIGDNR
jgi:hypothetical protein